MATTDNPIKEAALAYAERGFRPIAIHRVHNGCCSCAKGLNCPSAGKHPVDTGWQSADRMTVSQIETVWGRDKVWNVGIATGPDSNLLVLDIDPKDGGKESLKALNDQWSPDSKDWAKTYTVETGSGGLHFYFKYPDFEVGNSAGKLGSGIDTRGKGGQVVAPPSVSGVGGYTLIRDLPVIDAPGWLLDLLRPKERKVEIDTEKALLEVTPAERQRLDGYAQGAVQHEVERLLSLEREGWKGKPWDITTFEVACNLIQLANAPWSTYTKGQAYSDLFSHAPRDPGFDDERVNAKFESALKTVGDNEAAYPPRTMAAFFLNEDVAPSMPTPEQKTQSPQVTDDFDDFVADAPLVEAPEIPKLVAPGNIAGIPAIDGYLDPLWERKARADLLGTAYREREHVDIVVLDPDDLPDEALSLVLDVPRGAEGDLSTVDAWIGAALRAGTPELLWAALGAVVRGVDTDAPTIVFKGGGPLLRLLAQVLRPAVGETPETLLVGPRISTKETGPDEKQVVFEFADIPIDLTPYADAIVARALATETPLEPMTIEKHDELEKQTDYRAAQLHRARLGMGSRPRDTGGF